MARQVINNLPANSGLGDTLKVAFDKVNAMTLELYNQNELTQDEFDTINNTLADLQIQINGKANLIHTHSISQINGLQGLLDSKVNTTTFNSQIIAINSLLNDIINELNTKISDAPQDGETYGRQDGEWVELNSIRTPKTITGTTYTLVEEDKDKILNFTSNTDVVITIPTGLSPNNRYEGKQLGTGQLIFGADIGVTLRVGASELAKTAEQYSPFALDVIGTEEYMLYGKLELS
jgi:hypothetical protein